MQIDQKLIQRLSANFSHLQKIETEIFISPKNSYYDFNISTAASTYIQFSKSLLLLKNNHFLLFVYRVSITNYFPITSLAHTIY